MSIGYMCGPLCYMPDGITSNAQVAKDSLPQAIPHGFRYGLGIQDEISLKNLFRRQWQISRDPALKAEVNRLQKTLTNQLNE